MIRRLMAGAALALSLMGPALAAPNVLSGSYQPSGTCLGTSVTTPFTVLPFAREGTFDVQYNFRPTGATSTAVGTITLTRSTDGGQTFQPIMAGSQNLGQLAATGGLLVQQIDPTHQFRFECSITSGQIGWTVETGGQASGAGAGLAQIGRPLATYANSANGQVIGYNGGLTAAQIQALYETKYAPLSAADLPNITTGYRTAGFFIFNPDGSHTGSTAFVTLSIPSSATKTFSGTYQRGNLRMLSTTAATVTSIVDGNGNSLPAAFGFPPTVYTVGATITKDDAGYGNNVQFYPTLREAVDAGAGGQANIDGPNPGKYPRILPNANALGL